MRARVLLEVGRELEDDDGGGQRHGGEQGCGAGHGDRVAGLVAAES